MAEESPLKFPKQAEVQRISDYDFYDKIYYGDHYAAFSIRAEKDFSEQYSRLRYIVANFGRLISSVMADMLFGEKLTIDLEDQKNQDFIDGLIEENKLILQLYESALANSRRGDSVFKLRVGPRNVNDLAAQSSIIIEEQTPAIYFPEFDEKNAKNEPALDVLAWTFTVGQTVYLHKESHRPGFITHEIFKYDPQEKKIISEENPEDFGYPALEETKVKRSLVFHIPNVRDGSGFWGASDYKDLISLFFALNNRLTKTDNILDKHSDPILAVPPGVLDEKGKIKRSKLNLFEVDSENPGFNKPEYIVWNANLDAAEKEVDRLIELLFMLAETSPATMGMDKNGLAESGRALKFKLLATIRKRNRKMRYYDQAIKDMLETAQELAIAHGVAVKDVRISKSERPKIDWGDGVINDEVEMVDIAVKRIDAGLSSRADEIAHLDGLTPDEAKDKVEEIDKEEAANLPLTTEGAQFAGDKPIPQPAGNPNQPNQPAQPVRK
jgi:hypothetical protein